MPVLLQGNLVYSCTISSIYVTHWAKTRHIPHFMKIKTRNWYIDVYLCSRNKWTRSVAWFLSYGAKCIADVECNFSRKHNVFTLLRCLRTLSCYVKWTHVLVKRQLKSWQRQLGKTAVVKVGAYIVSIVIKTTLYTLEACEIASY